ncbi:hypothetical protein TNCT_146241 [Trichonephila clavata]|uniref:Uncharacterized protein n=1 Tax=Trichonephila clavata TaxID=2740835 RepID=A0A8X6F6T6_TRICU|nr:hypothetical protein TNCT_146241 [Trichonephila clavata]
MLTRGISKPEQVSNTKTNPEINETSEGLPKKLEKEQVDGMYELVREHFYSLSGHCLINTVEDSLDNLIHMWFVKSDLTENQRKLNIELLNILSAYSGEEDVYVARLKKFFRKKMGKVKI